MRREKQSSAWNLLQFTTDSSNFWACVFTVESIRASNTVHFPKSSFPSFLKSRKRLNLFSNVENLSFYIPPDTEVMLELDLYRILIVSLIR